MGPFSLSTTTVASEAFSLTGQSAILSHEPIVPPKGGRGGRTPETDTLRAGPIASGIPGPESGGLPLRHHPRVLPEPLRPEGRPGAGAHLPPPCPPLQPSDCQGPERQRHGRPPAARAPRVRGVGLPGEGRPLPH